jgi:hypothetical protein
MTRRGVEKQGLAAVFGGNQRQTGKTADYADARGWASSSRSFFIRVYPRNPRLIPSCLTNQQSLSHV